MLNLFLFKKILGDKRGNFAIIAAFILPLIVGVVGISIDISRTVSLKSRMQGAADSATLIVTKRLVEEDISIAEAEKLASSMFLSQIFQGKGQPANVDLVPVIKITKTKYRGKIHAGVSISAKGNIKSVMPLKIFNNKALEFDSSSKSDGQSETKSALSMFLVLDRSGSMDWDGRMRSLKNAVAGLTRQLETADPDKKYVRTGAVSYNHYAQRPQKLQWGTRATNDYVQRLPADGGTDSSHAMKRARNELKNHRESSEHAYKNGDSEPTKIIIFMTDGSNNYYSADYHTRKWCDKAKKEKVLIFTVAFQAPWRGKQLLKNCATNAGYYFEANNASALYDAFKAIGAKAADMLVILKN